jgi:hypothetical protein
MPDAPSPDANKEAQSTKETKAQERKALQEQQKRELPTDDWPGKGAD